MAVKVIYNLTTPAKTLSVDELEDGKAYICPEDADDSFPTIYVGNKVHTKGGYVVAFSLCGSFVVWDTDEGAFIEIDLKVEASHKTN